MLVNRQQFKALVEKFSLPGQYGFDTETTGLSEKDRLFSIILADEDDSYYFNFNWTPDHLGTEHDFNTLLPRQYIEEMRPIFENRASLFFIHNAKFDLRMLSYEGISILGTVHCTYAMERILHNNLPGYSLDACAARRGKKKDDRVKEYLKEHKLIEKYTIPGKDKTFENHRYDLVPLALSAEYGATDGQLVRFLGKDQVKQLWALDATAAVNVPKLANLMENERKLTMVCHRIERAGIPIDREYTQKCLEFTQSTLTHLKKVWKERTGIEFEDSPKVLQGVFKTLDIDLPLTPTGLPATNKYALADMDNWIATLVQDIRHQELLSGVYFSSFLHFADNNHLVHANIWQAGTVTGRFSYSDPNLQNLPKEDEDDDRDSPCLVRRCFVPLNSEWSLGAIDYCQQEFRLLLDYAGETTLIKKVLAGEDVHDATAAFLGVSRKHAKTLNFGLLYGMGAAKLGRQLKLPIKEATELRHLYFHKLPKVKQLIRRVMNGALQRRWIYNWNGFRYHLMDDNLAYQLPNHLIQGGGAQVIRVAMVRIDDFIRKHKLRSHIVAQIHDELVFMMHDTEIDYLVDFQKIMEGVYKPFNALTLECNIETSRKSLAKWDMEPFNAGRNAIQDEGSGGP